MIVFLAYIAVVTECKAAGGYFVSDVQLSRLRTKRGGRDLQRVMNEGK
jgi:hypothetical protein